MITQFIASLLLAASWDIPRPEFHRHELARRDLLRCMRRNPPDLERATRAVGERIKPVTSVSDPPAITPEVAKQLSDEGARDSAAFMERTRAMTRRERP